MLKFKSLNSDYDYFMFFINNYELCEALQWWLIFNLKISRETASGDKDDYVSDLITDRKRKFQARFYQFYAYFLNMIKSGVGAPVRRALAFIFLNSLTTMGGKGLSAILRMTATYGRTLANDWDHFLYPTMKSTNQLPEQDDIIRELHKQFKRIEIRNEDFKNIIDSVNQEVINEREELSSDSKMKPRALFYVDSPYIATKGYDAGKFSSAEMGDLIQKLKEVAGVGNKFIFSCRACGTKMAGSKTNIADKDIAIRDAVFKPFKNSGIPLWVTTISRSGRKNFFTDLVVSHNEAEIMITNYEVYAPEQSFVRPSTKITFQCETFTFDDFLKKLAQTLPVFII